MTHVELEVADKAYATILFTLYIVSSGCQRCARASVRSMCSPLTRVKRRVSSLLALYRLYKSLLHFGHVKHDPVELVVDLFLAAKCLAFVTFKVLALYIER